MSHFGRRARENVQGWHHKRSRRRKKDEEEATKIINLTTTSYKLWLRCHTETNGNGNEQWQRALPENKSSSIIHFHCTPHRFIYGGCW